jgi:hypothetical protein
MKTIRETPNKYGGRRVTVELNRGETLVAIRDDSFYRLSHPMDEVVPSHVVAFAYRVVWCPIGQSWVESD